MIKVFRTQVTFNILLKLYESQNKVLFKILKFLAKSVNYIMKYFPLKKV